MKKMHARRFIQNTIQHIVDIIFLPTEAECILRNYDHPAQNLYQQGQHANTVYLADYNNPVTKAAIQANKFQQHPQAAAFLGEIVATWIKSRTDQLLFIPIPLSDERLQSRKHNQVETILRAVPQKILVETKILTRTRNTTPQTSLPRTKRLQNIKGAFAAHDLHTLPSSCTIVLVDDVVTTGATLDEAYQIIKKQLPNRSIKILRLAVAH